MARKQKVFAAVKPVVKPEPIQLTSEQFMAVETATLQRDLLIAQSKQAITAAQSRLQQAVEAAGLKPNVNYDIDKKTLIAVEIPANSAQGSTN